MTKELIIWDIIGWLGIRFVASIQSAKHEGLVLTDM